MWKGWQQLHTLEWFWGSTCCIPYNSSLHSSNSNWWLPRLAVLLHRWALIIFPLLFMSFFKFLWWKSTKLNFLNPRWLEHWCSDAKLIKITLIAFPEVSTYLQSNRGLKVSTGRVPSLLRQASCIVPSLLSGCPLSQCNWHCPLPTPAVGQSVEICIIE